MRNVRTLRFAGWQTHVSDTPFLLLPSIVRQCLQLVYQANRAFVREDTAAWRLLGEPTAFGRLDFTIVGPQGEQVRLDAPNGRPFSVEGVVRPHEWEERPAGMGIGSAIDPGFAKAFDTIRGDWPNIRVAIDPSRAQVGYDDFAWVGHHNVTHGPSVPYDEQSLVLVRAEPYQREYHQLGPRSISTVRTEGDKSYGARLGWWKPVTQLDDLPRPGVTTVVLKPVQGSKTKGMLIAPARSRDAQPGMVTRGRLERFFMEQVARNGKMYLQPWHHPISIAGQSMILRVFFARGFSSPAWYCLGGVWALRKSALVHGATDTLFGPAVVG